MNKNQLKILNLMTIPMIMAMGFASGMGMIEESIYIRETASIAAQGIGQDFVNLFIAAPALIISLILLNRRSKTASFVFAGLIFYYLYSYIIYTFGIRHNNLFLVYCLTLSLCVYILIFWIHFNNNLDVKSWFKTRPPTRLTGIFLIVIAFMFYMLWLKDIVPPLLKGKAPEFVIENNYLINPVHAIDLSFALPGLIITSILLFKNHKMAYILSPVLNVFIIILTIALIGMVVMLKKEGINDDISVTYIFAVLSIIGTTILYLFLKPLSIQNK